MDVYPVILAGGIGERLYPLSTPEYPKFLLKVNKRLSLIGEAFSRAKVFAPPSRIYVITTTPLKEKVVSELYREGFIPANIIEEPVRRNTLPAFILSALTVPDNSILCFLPSDHIISSTSLFKRAMLNAISIADEGFLTLIGIKPSHPTPVYGYIIKGKRYRKGYFIEKFVEKPSLQKAKRIIKAGGLWNSGIYIVRKDVLIRLAEEFTPYVMDMFRRTKVVTELYSRIPSLQFDKSITEKTERSAVVKGQFEWYDIGSVNALIDYIVKHNAVVSYGDVSFKGSRRIIAVSETGRLCIKGVCDMIIINTKNGVEVRAIKKCSGRFYGKS